MEYTKIERLLILIAWNGLIGGILLGTLASKGTLESGLDMCVPQALFTFIGSFFVSLAGRAILMQLVSISKKQREIHKHLKEKKD